MVRMVNPVVLHWMPISTTKANGEAGFTLIELLVVLALVGVALALATLAIPNHTERYWRDHLEALRVSLNAAQDEAILSAVPITVEIDSQGWRFYQNTRAVTLQAMGDPFLPRTWQIPVTVKPTVWQLGAEPSTTYEALEIQGGDKSTQTGRRAMLVRNANGQFVIQLQNAASP